MILPDLHSVPNGQAKGNADPTDPLNDLVIAGADTFTFDTEKIVLKAETELLLLPNRKLSPTVSYLEV